MAEKIGLEAVLKDTKFQQAVDGYIKSLGKMEIATSSASEAINKALASISDATAGVVAGAGKELQTYTNMMTETATVTTSTTKTAGDALEGMGTKAQQTASKASSSSSIISSSFSVISSAAQSAYNIASSATTSYISSVQSLTTTLTNAAGQVGSAYLSIGNTLNSALGYGALAGITAVTTAVVGVGAAGVYTGYQLDSQFSAIAATMNKTVDEIAPLKELIKDLALDPELKVSTTEAADGIQMLAQNGLTMNQILGDGKDITTSAAYAVTLLANATGGKFALSADIATDVMKLWKEESQDMIGVVNGITSVVNNSKFTIEDYAYAIAQGGAVAAQTGVPFNEFNASIAAMSAAFASGQDAGTSFKTMMQRLAAPTDDMRALLNQLGISFYDLNGNLLPMADIVGQLNQALYGTSQSMVEVNGRTADQSKELARLQGIYDKTKLAISDYEMGIKGATLSDSARANKLEELNGVLLNTEAAMQPLLDITGELVPVTRQLTEEERSNYLTRLFGADATRAAGELAKMTKEEYEALMATMGDTNAMENAATRMDNLAGDVEILKGILESFGITIYDTFQPAMRAMVQAATDVATVYGAPIMEAFQSAVESIPGLIAIATGPQGLQKLVDMLFNQVGKSFKVFEDGTTIVSRFFTALGMGQDDAQAVSDYLRDMMRQARPFAMTMVNDVIPALLRFTPALAGVAALFGSAMLVSGIVSFTGALLSLINPVTLLIGAAAALGMAWSENWLGIQDIVGPVIESVGVFITTLVDSLWNGVPALTAFFGALMTAGVPAETIQSIIDFGLSLQGLIAQITVFVTENYASFEGALYGLAAGIAVVAASIATLAIASAVAAALSILLNPITLLIGAMTLLGAAWYGNWYGIQEITNQAIATITFYVESGLTYISNLWASVGSTVTTVIADYLDFAWYWHELYMTSIKGTVGYVLNDLWMLWEQYGGLITNLVVGLMTVIGALIYGATQAWMYIWRNWGDEIIAFSTSSFQVVYQVIVFPLKALLFFIDGLVKGITYLWETFGADLITGATFAWNTVSTTIMGVLNGLYYFVEGIVNLLMGDWEGAWESMKLAVSNVLAAILSAVSFGLPTIAVLFQAMVEAVLAAITSVDWGETGNSIVQGIANGISSGAQSVVDAAVGLAKMAYDAAMGELDAHSPSKLFIEVGGFIPAGMAIGIESGIETVEAVCGEMVDGITSAITGGLEEVPEGIGQGIVEGIGQGIESTPIDSYMAMFGLTLEEAMEQQLYYDKKEAIRGTGERIIGALTEGVQNGGGYLLSELSAFGGRLSGIATKLFTKTGGAGALIDEILGPKFEKQMADAEMALGQLKGSLASTLGIESEALTEQRLMGEFWRAHYAGNEAVKAQIEEIWAAQNRLNLAKADEARIAEKQASLTATQNQYEMLQQQVELVEALRQAGMNPAEILQGVQLGMDASWEDMLDATNAAMEALVQATSQQLQLDVTPKTVEQQIAQLKDQLGGQLRLTNPNDQQLTMAYFKAVKSGNNELIAQIDQLWRLQGKLNMSEEEYLAYQQQLLDIQNQQQQMDFLKQQLDIINMLRQSGLDPTEILAGINFGLDATIPDLVAAMQAAMQAMVAATEDELEIASPSKVMERIGAFAMQGFVDGIKEKMNQPMNLMRTISQTMAGQTSPINNIVAPAPVVQVNGGSETNEYNLSLNTSQTALSLRRQFKLMEAARG